MIVKQRRKLTKPEKARIAMPPHQFPTAQKCGVTVSINLNTDTNKLQERGHQI
jgi:hypothetical protein